MLTKITQIIVAFSAVAAVFVSIYTAVQVNIVHVSINSRMDQLLDLTQKASKAEGLKEGQEQLR